MPLPDRLFHLTPATNWPLIERGGLRPAHALIADAFASRAARDQIDRHHRPQAVALLTGATISDQKPMPPASLARALVGVTPDEWYALVNRHVFFWPDIDRLRRLRRVYLDTAMVLIVADTRRLLDVHGANAFVTPINVGNARRRPARRGPATFVPLAAWQARGWADEAAALGTTPRPRSHPPAEVAIRGAVPTLEPWLVEARPLSPGETVD